MNGPLLSSHLLPASRLRERGIDQLYLWLLTRISRSDSTYLSILLLFRARDSRKQKYLIYSTTYPRGSSTKNNEF